MIADLPAFGIVISLTDGFPEQIPEPAASPANTFQDGRTFERSQAGQSPGIEDDRQMGNKIISRAPRNPSKNLFTQWAEAWYSRSAMLRDQGLRFSIIVLIYFRAFQPRQEAVMRESPIEPSRVELSVGDSVRIDDQILIVLDISEDEVTFADAVDDLNWKNSNWATPNGSRSNLAALSPGRPVNASAIDHYASFATVRPNGFPSRGQTPQRVRCVIEDVRRNAASSANGETAPPPCLQNASTGGTAPR